MTHHFICYWILWNLHSVQLYVSPNCNPCWFSKPDIVRAHLSGAESESWDAWWGIQTPCSLGKSSRFVYLFEIPPNCGLFHQGYGFWLEHVSAPPTHLTVVLLLLQSRCSSSSQVLLKRNCSICSCMYTGEGEFMYTEGEFSISLCQHLEPSIDVRHCRLKIIGRCYLPPKRVTFCYDR